MTYSGNRDSWQDDNTADESRFSSDDNTIDNSAYYEDPTYDTSQVDYDGQTAANSRFYSDSNPNAGNYRASRSSRYDDSSASRRESRKSVSKNTRALARNGAHGVRPPDRGNKSYRQDEQTTTSHRRRLVLSRILLIFSILCFAVALIGLGSIAWQYMVGEKQYTNLEQYNLSDKVSDEASQEAMVWEDYTLKIDWAQLKNINSDIVAWIYVPDTPVNYPVVQTTDNEHYLTQTFDGTGNRYGCIFLDKDSAKDFTDYHSIFYGHNMRNGSMFHEFVDYPDQDFWNAHPYIFLGLPDGTTWRLQVVSAYVASGDEKLRQTAFGSQDAFTTYVQDVLNRSTVNSGVDASQITHLFSFVTCSYQFDDARTLVHAVEIDKSGAITNSAVQS